MEGKVLCVAVISDLHAYDKNTSKQQPSHLEVSLSPDEPRRHPVAGLLKIIQEQGLTADLLLCPGDLGDQALPHAIRYAWTAVNEVGRALKAPVIVGCTGNHDVDSRKKYDPYDPRAVLQKLKPPFPLSDENDNNKYWSKHFVLKEYSLFRLLILNSAAYHFQQQELDHGRIAPSTIEDIENGLEASQQKPVNIVLCHHHPEKHQDFYTDDYEAMALGEKLVDVLGSGKYGQWLFVHGHRHFPKLTYAKGGSGSPVIFSAGSFSAVLYPDLSTLANNQFYLIYLPLAEIASMGLVGTVRAWDWAAAGRGWRVAANGRDIPDECGFGNRDNAASVATKMAHRFPADKTEWDVVRARMPEVDYILPTDLLTVRRELASHQMTIFMKGGIPLQLGRLL